MWWSSWVLLGDRTFRPRLEPSQARNLRITGKEQCRRAAVRCPGDARRDRARPDPPRAAHRPGAGRCATPTRGASSTSATRSSCSSRPCCRRRPPTCGSTSRRPSCSRASPTRRRWRPPTPRCSRRSCGPRGSSGPRRARCRGCRGRSSSSTAGQVPGRLVDLVKLPGRRAARPRTWCSATRSASPASPRTRTCSGSSSRLGLTDSDDPLVVEKDLCALLPRRDWTMASHRLIFHGRRTCFARRPACGACPVAALCPSARDRRERPGASGGDAQGLSAPSCSGDGQAAGDDRQPVEQQVGDATRLLLGREVPGGGQQLVPVRAGDERGGAARQRARGAGDADRRGRRGSAAPGAASRRSRPAP